MRTLRTMHRPQCTQSDATYTTYVAPHVLRLSAAIRISINTQRIAYSDPQLLVTLYRALTTVTIGFGFYWFDSLPFLSISTTSVPAPDRYS
jgi:hypothetical protein